MNPENIPKLIISPQTSIKEAMKNISRNHERVLFVINPEKKLMGSVTDGDIRRALLNGIGFECPVYEIMYKSPRSVQIDDIRYRDKAKKFMKKERHYAIPVLDKSDKIIDILSWYDFFEDHPSESLIIEPLSNPVIIMAGGKGTRLDPLTKILPKPLIPIDDQPIIEKIMARFHKDGFRNFILTLNYKKELIKTYFKENSSPYKITFIEERDYLGTAGSLGLLKNQIQETFFVSNCDTILDTNLRNILRWHEGEKAIISLVGCHKEMVIPYGTLDMKEGHLKQIHEKPKFDFLINTGVYIMEPEALKFISEEEDLDMNKLIERVAQHGKITVFPLYEGWFDLGQWHDYHESLHRLRANR